LSTFLLAPDPVQQQYFLPGTATPGNGVQVFVYRAGTVTKINFAKDNAGNAFWSNPQQLDSSGNWPSAGSAWLPENVSCKVVWAPAADSDPPSSPYRTIDNMAGVPAAVAASTSQWVSISSPNFVNGAAFRVSGDQTAEIHVGRRIRTENTGGTVYSRVSSSSFGTSTTVGLINDSGSLDSGLSTAAYGLLSATNPSIPLLTDFYPLARSSTNTAGVLKLNLQALTSSSALTVQNTTAGVIGLVGDFQYGNLTSTNARLLYPPGHIQGLILSNSGATAVACSAGSTVNSSATQNLILSSAITKDPTSSWAVSSGNGGLLDTGSMSSNIWYWAHLLKRTDGGWVDFGFSSSYAAPALPSGYTIQSNVPVGAIRRAAASTTPFLSLETAGGGIQTLWSTPPYDLDAQIGTAVSTVTLSVPNGQRVNALLNALAVHAGVDLAIAYLTSPEAANQQPSDSASPLSSLRVAGGGATTIAAQVDVRTNTSSQINATATMTSMTLRIATRGWDWSRR
jgi:hypothetical protein